jgi:hypothetical protein
MLAVFLEGVTGCRPVGVVTHHDWAHPSLALGAHRFYLEITSFALKSQFDTAPYKGYGRKYRITES